MQIEMDIPTYDVWSIIVSQKQMRSGFVMEMKDLVVFADCIYIIIYRSIFKQRIWKIFFSFNMVGLSFVEAIRD